MPFVCGSALWIELFLCTHTHLRHNRRFHEAKKKGANQLDLTPGLGPDPRPYARGWHNTKLLTSGDEIRHRMTISTTSSRIVCALESACRQGFPQRSRESRREEAACLLAPLRPEQEFPARTSSSLQQIWQRSRAEAATRPFFVLPARVVWWFDCRRGDCVRFSARVYVATSWSTFWQS